LTVGEKQWVAGQVFTETEPQRVAWGGMRSSSSNLSAVQ